MVSNNPQRTQSKKWPAGRVPIAVVLISLNEGHNLEAVLDNLANWAQEVFLVDSYSRDGTIDIALRYGIHVVQRRFRGFGDQWNFAVRQLPIAAPWTLKLDPDERLTNELKVSIEHAIRHNVADGLCMTRGLYFMGRPLPVEQLLTRAWRTGQCTFTDVKVNEHPLVHGSVARIQGRMEHHDSPDLDHWLEKQNRYTTAEAVAAFREEGYADEPRVFGTTLQRRMWMKKHYMKVPLRYSAMFLYHYAVLGAWRAGWVGYAWSRLRCDVYRLREFKLREMTLTRRVLDHTRVTGPGVPDRRVPQYD